MSFLNRHELTTNQDFRIKVKMASLKAAIAVLADPERTDEHPYSTFLIKEPNSTFWLDQIVFGVVQNPAITGEATDSDIEYTVNSIYTNYSKSFQ